MNGIQDGTYTRTQQPTHTDKLAYLRLFNLLYKNCMKFDDIKDMLPPCDCDEEDGGGFVCVCVESP